MSLELLRIGGVETGVGNRSDSSPVKLMIPLGDLDAHKYIPQIESPRIALSFNAHLLDPSQELRQLITRFEHAWDSTAGRFNVEFKIPEFVKIMNCYNSSIPKIHDPLHHFGFIEKQDVNSGSQIFIRADLHGDLKSVIEHLSKLQEEGLLDKNYRCKAGFNLVFLGDYSDRGHHNLETLTFLLLIKLINRDQTYLIRGNHETVSVNATSAKKAMKNGKGDPNFETFLNNSEYRKALADTYDTMPLSVYFAQKTAGRREYFQCTHTGFEPTVDPAIMIDSANDREIMLVSKEFRTSERMTRLFAQAQDSSQEMDSHVRQAALTLFELIKQDSTKEFRTSKDVKEVDGKTALLKCAYSWPQINRSSETISMSTDVDSDAGWQISPAAYRAYQLLSSAIHAVEMTARGHDHTFSDISLDGKIFVKTLPIGADSPISKKRGPVRDTAWLLTTGPTIAEWQKDVYSRIPRTSETKRHGPYSLLQSQIQDVEENK